MDCDIEVMIGKIEGKTDKNVYYLEAEVLAASEISEGDRSGECCELQAADFWGVKTKKWSEFKWEAENPDNGSHLKVFLFPNNTEK